MKAKILTSVIFVLLLGPSTVFAAEGMVTISSPANGATVNSHDSIELNYEAVPGTDGDHMHLNLDGKRIDIIRPMKGAAHVGMLDPGKHRICLAINTRGHVPTGVEACVDVMSK